MNIIHVNKITERQEKYSYHGADLAYRERINHDEQTQYVIDIEDQKWPSPSPEECTDETFFGDWYECDGKEYLLCRGCGLDCT